MLGRSLAFVALVVVTIGCGSGALTREETSTGTTTPITGETTSVSDPPMTTTADDDDVDDVDDDGGFGWGLPVGDTSVSLNEAILYARLYRGACDEAQQFLDTDDTWRTLLSPRAVLLYQSAIDFCAGDADRGREMFLAADADGWAGIDFPDIDCQVYRSASSVVHQADRATFDCPGGAGPTWPSDDPTARDDPRTPVDESSTTSTSSTSSEPSTTTAPTTSPPSTSNGSAPPATPPSSG